MGRSAQIRSLGAILCAAVAIATLAAQGCGRAPRHPPVQGARTERLQSTHLKEEATARPVMPVEVPKGDPKSLAALAVALRGAPTPASTTDVPRVTSLALDATARGEARGLRQVGAIEHARLAEGGYATREIALRPGDCVTGIAHGSLGVMEVDAFLILADPIPSANAAAPTSTSTATTTSTSTSNTNATASAPLTTLPVPPDAPAVLAMDLRGGPIAVFGGAAGCYAFTGISETRCKLVVLARRGEGEVVFALYKTAGSEAGGPGGNTGGANGNAGP